MSESTMKVAVAGLISNDSTLAGLVKTVRTHLPNFSTELLPAPWCLVVPGTMVWDAEEAGDNQLHGCITVVYFDDLGDEGQPVPLDPGPIMDAAEAFAIALRAALARDWTIGGQLISAGKEDFGVTIHYADAGEVQSRGQRAYYCIPIDIYVRDFIG